MSIEYWVSCARDPWPALAEDDAFGEIVDALRADGEYSYGAITMSLVDEAGPSFVPAGSVVLNVSGRSGADWDEVIDFLDAIASAGDGVVLAEDEEIIFDHRKVKPALPPFTEAPGWSKQLAAKHKYLEVVVFATREPLNPRAELERVGLEGLAKRVHDVGLWSDSRFGEVRCQSIPRGSFDWLAEKAGVDPRGFPLAMHFTNHGDGDWTDALVSAQVLAYATKGRAFALTDAGAEELPAPGA